MENVTVFILLGLSDNHNIEVLCFVLFLFCSIAIWMGNVFIMVSIMCTQRIDQSMDFFLYYLSVCDLCYTSTMTPKLLADLLRERNIISYNNYVTQLFVLHLLGAIENFIFTAMTYDCYVAIRRPLHYTVIMSRERCNEILAACCTGGFGHSASQSLLIAFLSFCHHNEIDHYLCDVYPLLKLACTDAHRIGLFFIVDSGLIALMTLVVLMVSYSLILHTVSVYPAESHSTALSTCSSHVTIVVLLVLFIYIRPNITFPEDKVFALFYTIIAPMFSSLIYTLRNTEMKHAIKKNVASSNTFIQETYFMKGMNMCICEYQVIL